MSIKETEMDRSRVDLSQIHRPAHNTGVKLQAYTRAFKGDLWGLAEEVGYLKFLGVDGLISSPTFEYPADAPDGPYAPLVDARSMPRVAKQLGGDGALQALHSALGSDIIHIMDAVVGHMSEKSRLWQRALAGNAQAQEYFRLITNPGLEWAAKVNIFGLENLIRVPELGPGVFRSATFYPDQVEYDITSPAVQRLHAKLIGEHMIDRLGAGGARLDAIAYVGGRTMETPDGTHNPSGLAYAQFLRREVFDLRPGTISIAEAGGSREGIREWLRNRRCHWAYDFGIAAIVMLCLLRQ